MTASKEKRGKRIDEKKRNLKRWVRVVKDWYWSDKTTEAEKVEHARKYANHGKLCSCDGCCNPRRSGYNKKREKLTIQERRFDEYTDTFKADE